MIRASVQVQFLVPTVQTDDKVLEENVLVTFDVPVSEASYFYLVADTEEDFVGKHPVRFEDVLSPDVLEYIFTKSLGDDIAYAGDSTIAFVKKASADEASTSESYHFQIVKDIQDSLGATDDFLGEANIDDDQVALVVKPRYERTSAADDDTIDFEKNVVDPVEAAADDNVTVDLQRPIDDPYTSGDEYVSHLTKPVYDDAESDDVQTAHVTKNRGDDLAYAGDATTAYVKKVATDEPLTSEETTVNIIKVFFDHIGVTDDFYGDANPDDDQTMDFDKNVNVTDSDAGVVDEQTSDVNKPSVDVAGLVEKAVYEFSKLSEEQVAGLDEAVVSFLAARADFSVFDDYVTSAFTKDVKEDLGATDDFLGDANIDDDQIAIVVKPLHDRPKVGETTTYSSTKPRFDEGSITDDAPYELVKPREDAAATSDVYAAQVGKPLADSAAAAEDVTQALSKPLEDSSQLAEKTTLGLQTPRLDEATTDDQLTSAFVKDVSDNLGATDDFLGQTNIDDDQTSHINRPVEDTLELPERVLVSSGKSVDDAAHTAEVVNAEVVKAAEDEAAFEDAVGLSAVKPISDYLGVTDHLSISIAKFRADGLLAPDESLVYYFPFEGIPSQEDPQAVQDRTTVNNWKSFSDYGTCVETVYALTYKRLSDTCGLSNEAHTLTLRRELTESVHVQNSGFVVMTDYCDSSYFAEPFVGVGREIT